jgi:hypothetical protein
MRRLRPMAPERELHVFEIAFRIGEAAFLNAPVRFGDILRLQAAAFEPVTCGRRSAVDELRPELDRCRKTRLVTGVDTPPDAVLRFEQQHGPARLGQPGGCGQSRHARADHHHVICRFHRVATAHSFQSIVAGPAQRDAKMPAVSSPLPLTPFAPPIDGIVRSLEATVQRHEGGLLLFRFMLEADLSRIRVPALRSPRQVYELWKHTCFEAFIAPAGTGYCELNFAPSTEWAAYGFNDYRQGMTSLAVAAPDIRIEATPSRLQLDARIDGRELLAAAKLDASSPELRIALSAVLEDGQGTFTYWALKHAPARPDFHHPAGFILEV